MFEMEIRYVHEKHVLHRILRLPLVRFCSPRHISHRSVLDRLNPLLEPGGVLPLTECGTAPDVDDGLPDEQPEASGAGSEATPTGVAPLSSSGHRVIRPHPNFRLFLTADPSCGEVSRAMRNRCVEISLLDAPPAVAVLPAPQHADDDSIPNVPVMSVTEHAGDLLSLVRLAGLSDSAEANAAVAVHSALVARRARGRGNSAAGEGPSPRLLSLWAQLTAAFRSRRLDPAAGGAGGEGLLRCLSLAYPGLSPGVGSSAEAKLAEAVLWSCFPVLSRSQSTTPPGELLESVVPCGWMQLVDDSVAGQVMHDVRILKTACMGTSGAGLGEAEVRLLSLIVDSLDTGQTSRSTLGSNLRLDAGDAAFLHKADTLRSSPSVSLELVTHSAVLFARRASPSDRLMRVAWAARLSNLSTHLQSSFERAALTMDLDEAVPKMMAALYDTAKWREVCATLSEMAAAVAVEAAPISSVGQATTLAESCWSPGDLRANPVLFSILQRTFGESPKWTTFVLLLDLVDASVGRRLPLLLAEGAELTEARNRLRSGRGGDVGLGWLGLSFLVSDGGRDSSMVGGSRGGGGCSETRLARSALVPFLFPLLRAVDGVIEALVCRRAAELAIAESAEYADEVKTAVTAVLEARDTISCLLCPQPSTKDDKPGADASARHASTRRNIVELVFHWDPFLVAWRWLEQAVESLQATVSRSTILINLGNVAPEFATLSAVGARVNAAILEHAGGAVPTRDTLWNHGPRASAPSSAAGATALAKLRRLADNFRILPSGLHMGGVDTQGVSLARLMKEAHPALCVPVETRREFLHALCTLQWAASNEQNVDAVAGAEQLQQVSTLITTSAASAVGEPSVEGSCSRDAFSLAENLPVVLETTIEAARARFEAGHKGTRLGAGDRRDDGLQHHQDDLEFGEKFDDFDTEAAEAVSNATLLVVAGDGAHGAGGGDRTAGGGKVSGATVLGDWASVQLSPLFEHWIAVEECHVLSSFAKMDVSLACGTRKDDVSDEGLAALMRRVARLRSAMLAVPSLSPLDARPYQTLLWAFGDRSTWKTVRGPLLKRLLPVAMESFGRRLWENLVAVPTSVSLRLAPPDMVVQSRAEDSGDQHGNGLSGTGVDDAAFAGPVQLVKLARSSFLLRLLSTATFPGGVVPGGIGGGRDGVDLTLMNASARLRQYRVAMRGIRDLRYIRAPTDVSGALEPLVEMSWARLCRTLGAFDALDANSTVGSDEQRPKFVHALLSVRSGAYDRSLEMVQAPVREALGACPDERLVSHGEALLLPAVVYLSRAMAAFRGPAPDGPTPLVEATAGVGMSLLGCLQLVLLLPSTPVDPGLRPALKKELLGERLEGLKGELTVRSWSLRLNGGGVVSPEVSVLNV